MKSELLITNRLYAKSLISKVLHRSIIGQTSPHELIGQKPRDDFLENPKSVSLINGLYLKSQKSENRKILAKFLVISQSLEEALRKPQFSDLIKGLSLYKP